MDELFYQKQVGCLGLVATREPVSLNMIKKWSSQSKFKDQKALKIMLSGDISYSYVPHEAEIIRFKKKYQKKLMSLFLRQKKWVLVFSRFNNFGQEKGVWIEDGIVTISTYPDNVRNFNLENVVFATSSDLEDHAHMIRFERDYKVKADRIFTCKSIEEMFGLILLAPEVLTDRYHPGVVTSIYGIKLSIIKYPIESVKLTGLQQMTQYPKQNVEQMNEEAFNSLLNIFQT